MMKKVICLLLVFVCSLTIFGCGGETADIKEPEANPPAQAPAETPEGEKEPIASTTTVGDKDKAFFLLVEKSNPNVITTRSITQDKTNKVSYEGMFKTYVYGNDANKTEYRYEKMKELSPDDVGNGMKDSTEGVIYYANGKYSVDNSTWITGYPDVDILQVKLDLSAEKLGSYKIDNDGTTLTTTVTADAAEDILGVKVDAVGGVSITIKTNGTSLWKVNVSYQTLVAKVTIETTYTYEPLTAPVQ